MRIMVRDYFQAKGHEVLLAQDGAFGLSMSALELPDIIILDIMLPVMDGIEALQMLQREPHLRDIPVIAITASHDRAIEEEARAFGVAAYLAKPFEMGKLYDEVERILSDKPLPH